MRRLDWITFGLFTCGLALGMPGCGDDETQFAMDGSGGVSGGNGGSGGSGASSAGGNGSSSTGSGGTSGPSGTQLGVACVGDVDCPTGLRCLTAGSDSLSLGGPAHGFCTFECGGEDITAAEADEECQDYDANSLCQVYTEDKAYCVQRCTFGQQVTKCQNRDDVVCDLVLHEPEVTTTCEISDDCDIGDLCVGGQCFDTPQVCLPRCNSNNDCPADRFCDPRSGECVDEEPMGKPFGAECDPNAEVDECLGFCNLGTCLEFCVIGSYPTCGSTSTTEASADCLLVAYPEAQGIGDVGLCGQLCDCTDDCRGGVPCVQIEDAMGPFEWRGRPGICANAGDADTVLTECPAGGGGSGGEGGAAGAGGSP